MRVIEFRTTNDRKIIATINNNTIVLIEGELENYKSFYEVSINNISYRVYEDTFRRIEKEIKEL